MGVRWVKLLPMVLRINPSKALLWRNPNEVQFGAAADAVRLANLTAGQERLLGLLSRGIADDYFERVADAVGAENSEELLQRLEPVLLRDADTQADFSAEFIEARFAEICRAQAIHSREGQAVFAARQQRQVFVQASTSAQSLILQSLEQSAIGSLTSLELGAASSTIDFAVLLSNNAVAPSEYARWLSSGVAHVSAVFDSEGVSVSPIIETGKTPCLSCFHENQTAADLAWPALASQLLFSQQKFDESVASLFAAAIICQRVLQFCDNLAGFQSSNINTSGYRLSIGSGQITEFSWQFNPACACRIA